MKKNLGLTLAILAALSFSSVGNQAHAFNFFSWKKHQVEQKQVPVVAEPVKAEEVKVQTPVAQPCPCPAKMAPAKKAAPCQAKTPCPLKGPCPIKSAPAKK